MTTQPSFNQIPNCCQLPPSLHQRPNHHLSSSGHSQRCCHTRYLLPLLAEQIPMDDFIDHGLYSMASYTANSNDPNKKLSQNLSTNGFLYKIVTKFIVLSLTIHACPPCHSALEMVPHFLPCPHLECQAIWKELDDQLHHLINCTYHNLFHYSLLQGHQVPPGFDPWPNLSQS